MIERKEDGFQRQKELVQRKILGMELQVPVKLFGAKSVFSDGSSAVILDRLAEVTSAAGTNVVLVLSSIAVTMNIHFGFLVAQLHSTRIRHKSSLCR